MNNLFHPTTDLFWFETYLKHKSNNSDLIKTSFYQFDKLVDGFYQGTMTVIGAYPGVGKTTFVINLIERLMKNNKILVFTTEISKEKFMEKLASIRFELLQREVREFPLSILPLIEKLKNENLFISDVPLPTIDDVKRCVDIVGPRFLFFDYFQNFSLAGISSGWPSARAYANIVEKLAELMREKHLTVVLTSQLRKPTENRKPFLGDLKETGKLAEAAHVVALLSQEDNKLVVEIAKAREGELGEFVQNVNWKTGKFL